MSSARMKSAGPVAAVVVAAAAVGVLPPSFQTGPALAYVSTDAILRQTPGFAAAESTWTAEVVGMRVELEALSQKLDSTLSAFDQVSIGLSPAARQEKQAELQQLNRQYQQEAAAAQRRADLRQRELMAPLRDRMQSVIDGIRAERNLRMVFDLSAPGNNVIAADPTLDLTTLVVRRLRGSE